MISQWNFEQYRAMIGNRRESESLLKDEKRGEKIKKKETIVWKRLKFGAWVIISHRYIGTHYQARNTPPYSNSDTGSVFLACYLITDILLLGSQPELNTILFAESKVSFFRRFINHEITSQELFTRVTTTIGFWIGAFFTIQGFYSATGFLAIAFGLTMVSSPSEIDGRLLGLWGILI